MVANFWQASPHGSEMISTLVPGLAVSNLATIDFSVSVRSGLVITSTSLSVVSASAVPAIMVAKRAAVISLFIMSVSPSFGSLISCCGSHRRFDVAPQRLGSLEADMEAYGPRIDAKGMRGIRLCLLLKHDLARYDQAFMSAPA